MSIDKHKKLYVECSCNTKDHLVCIDYCVRSRRYGQFDRDVYIRTQLSETNGIFRRIWTAIKYVLGRSPCRYGSWNESIVDVEQAKKIVDLLQEYIDDSERELKTRGKSNE